MTDALKAAAIAYVKKEHYYHVPYISDENAALKREYESFLMGAAHQREVDAGIAENLWKNAPNEPPEFRQNLVSHGCIAAAQAIRAQDEGSGR